MWFCVMTSLIQHKEPLSWIYCIVKSWPQGFGREMSCSQVPEIFKAIYKWNLGHTEVNSKTLIFLGQKNLFAETWTFCRNVWTRLSVAWISGLSLQGEKYSFSQKDGKRPPTLHPGRGWTRHIRILSIPNTLSQTKPLCSNSAPLLHFMAPTLTLFYTLVRKH